MRGTKVELKNAIITGDDVTFSISPPQMRGATLDFEAKVTDDAMRGKVFFTFGGVGAKEIAWVALKQTEDK